MPTSPSPAGPLAHYWAKRDFSKTPEPRGARHRAGTALSYVVQKHDATRLHYDFRLELDGVLLSWAVPKGPSFDPADKRMAVRTEDHPLSYADFEGTIPPGQYGAGQVIVWDRGTWVPQNDPHEGLRAGKLAFELQGDKLAGLWELVRMKGRPGDRQEAWLLFKKRDDHARSRAEFDVVVAQPDSVLSAATLPAREAAASKKGRRAAASAPTSPPTSKPAATGKAVAAPAATAPAARKTTTRATGPRAAATALPGKAAPLPETLPPQLATLARNAPPDGDWSYEVKYDGYRVMTRIARGRPTLITRGGHDWTSRLPDLAADLRQLGIDKSWLDGELVVLNDQGVPDFNALQNAFDRQRTAKIVYFLFDAPFLAGRDLRALPLRERRALLQAVVDAGGSDRVRFSADLDADPDSLLASACRMGLEGVIAKRADAPYESRRSASWLKLKCQQRQEFVIVGFTARKNIDGAVGSLLLAVHDDQGRLQPVGSVGTGWDSEGARSLWQTLAAIETDHAPFASEGPARRSRWSRRPGAVDRWVRPVQVAEVAFGEWTPDRQIRHAVFVGLRSDKPARQITRENAVEAPTVDTAENTSTATSKARSGATGRGGTRKTAQAAATGTAAARRPAATGIQVSNPDRVIDAQSGTTKLDLVRFYEAVAPHLLPHLKGRPVSLVRGPSGVGGELFFQKHMGKMRIADVKELPASLWEGHEPLMEIGTPKALAAAAQMNTIEFHTWNTMARHFDKPDRIVFDIDPGEGVGWPQIQEAAILTRALLTELGLRAWLKTSGGKGLHVVVPIAPRQDWDTVKGFSQAVVAHMAEQIPDRFVAKSGPANRVGRIFIDYLRNGFGATTAAAYSARARPGLGVSMPIDWDQLPEVKSGSQWTVRTTIDHLSFRKEDPWADQASARQALGPALKRLKPRK